MTKQRIAGGVMPPLDLYKCQACHLLETIVTAKILQERWRALELAAFTFDHHNTQAHNDLCEAGCITLLTTFLEKSLLELEQCKQRVIRIPEGIELIYKALYFLFRCSDKHGSDAIERIGPDLISITVSIVHECGTLAPNSFVLKLMDRLASLKFVLLKVMKKANLLVRLLQSIIRNDYQSESMLKIGCKLLIGFTLHPENKTIISRHPSLVDDLISCLHEQSSEYINCNIAQVLMNLSWDLTTKLELTEKKKFFNAIIFFFKTNWQNTKLQKKAQLFVLETIQRLASEAVCRLRISTFGKGSILKILSIPKDPVDSPDLHISKFRTILRLMDQETTSKIMKKCPNLVKHFADTARLMCDVRESNSKRIHDEMSHTLNFASMTHGRLNLRLASESTSDYKDVYTSTCAINRLARHITVKDKSHPFLINTLTKLAFSDVSKEREWAAQGIREQSRTTAGRFYLVRASQVLDTLVHLANDENVNMRTSATEALLCFALDPLSVKRVAQRSDVLETFVRNAKPCDKFMTITRNSIQGIIALAMHDASQDRVAKTIDLIEVLTKYGISHDVDIDLKMAALRCVILLAKLM